MITQEILNEYFGNTWKPAAEDWECSGLALLDVIPMDTNILDVGCGYNVFKNYFVNLTGIDPANDNADEKVTIEEYQTNQKFDVALALGSINFGSKDRITKQTEKLISLLKDESQIFWRCNPGFYDHDDGSEKCKVLEFYPWTFEEMEEFAKSFGYTIVKMKMEKHKKHNRKRLYSHWKK